MAIGVNRDAAGGASIVRVSGEVDVQTAPTLADELTAVASATNAPKVVVDLSAVEFLDSTGLGVLVNARKEIAAADGRLAIVSTSARITKLFTITGLDEVFDVHTDVDSAVAAVSG